MPKPTLQSLASAAALLAALSASGPVLAAIVNGDFATGNFTGWTTDTDGNGAPTPLSPDFQVVGSPGSYQARIEADYWSTPGDTGSTPLDQVQFSNTLFQGLDLTVAPGFELLLSFDWAFASDNAGAPNPPDENVQIGLNDGSDFYDADGSLGFLLSATSYGSGTFSSVLGPFYNNAAGFSLDFQLNAGFDGYGSHLLVTNVSLTEQAVPLPGTALLMVPVLGLLGLRRRARA